jgi:hypothetical protein
VATAEKIQCPFAGCGVTVRVEEMKSHLDICPFGKFLNKVWYAVPRPQALRG